MTSDLHHQQPKTLRRKFKSGVNPLTSPHTETSPAPGMDLAMPKAAVHDLLTGGEAGKLRNRLLPTFKDIDSRKNRKSYCWFWESLSVGRGRDGIGGYNRTVGSCGRDTDPRDNSGGVTCVATTTRFGTVQLSAHRGSIIIQRPAMACSYLRAMAAIICSTRGAERHRRVGTRRKADGYQGRTIAADGNVDKIDRQPHLQSMEVLSLA